jgi:hypothetical protein
MIDSAGSRARVLMLGFSVTEDSSGYAVVAKRTLAASHPDVDVYICGIGGISPFPLPALFAHLNRQHGPFTHVFLEIATSIHGKRNIESVERDGLSVLFDLFKQIQANGAQIALINLYRDDFDYPYHYFDMLLEALSHRYRIPLLDLANGLLADEGKQFITSLLRDSVHTTASGSEFQGKAVSAFISEVLGSDVKNRKTPHPRTETQSLSIPALFPGRPQSNFRRAGLELAAMKVDEGEEIVIPIPEGFSFCGFSFVSGPLAGNFGVRFDGAGKELLVPAYDDRCYYERFNYRWFKQTVACKSVFIRLHPGRPPIDLKKGEPNNDPRVGELIAAYVSSPVTFSTGATPELQP